jgi:hypothetical protein
MTERWRERLGDLDTQGPSDEVFDLAKQGPRHTDEPPPGMRPSTRAATVVTAFAVFALAISVFAIPALRMQGTQAGGGAGGMFPIWPSQDSDQLMQLQSDADSGTAAWALDPQGVATAFGRQVLGWQDVTVSVPAELACGVAWGVQSSVPYIPQGASASYPGVGSMGAACVDPPWLKNSSANTRPSGDPSLSVSATTGIGSNGYFMRMFITPCAPRAVCNVIPLQSVTVYQPLEQGPGQIWAVLEAQDALIKLSIESGQNVRSGASVSGTFVGGGKSTPTIGYASCDSSGASSNNDTIADVGERIALQTDLHATNTCGGSEPGYVWGVRASRSFADPNGMAAPDPITGSRYLQGITAVPVTMTFPDQGPMTLPPNGGSEGIATPTPSNGTAGWKSFMGDLEWTMDVPSGWQSKRIAATSVTGSGGSGDEFTGDGLTVDVFQGTEIVGPADDSSFPLDYDTLLKEQNDGTLVGVFRGDGFPLNIRIAPEGSHVTPEQESILRHMVGSIAFPHIRAGGILAVHAALTDPVAQDQWMEAAGGTYILRSTSDGYIALGPVTCREDGQVHTHWDPSQTCPDSVNLAQWSASGTPAAGNAPGFQDPLPIHPVIRAWDGTLLALLEFDGGGGQDTSASPSPSPTP